MTPELLCVDLYKGGVYERGKKKSALIMLDFSVFDEMNTINLPYAGASIFVNLNSHELSHSPPEHKFQQHNKGNLAGTTRF